MTTTQLCPHCEVRFPNQTELEHHLAVGHSSVHTELNARRAGESQRRHARPGRLRDNRSVTRGTLQLIHVDHTPREAGPDAPRVSTPLESSEVGTLQRHTRYPAVSILMSHGASVDGDRARLKRLALQAATRLHDEFPRRDVQPLVRELDALVAAADLSPGHLAIGVFVNHDIATTLHLPIPVRERVVVDATFATRDLVHALHRSLKYQVLVLSERATRLYTGCGAALTEVAGSPILPTEPHSNGRGARPRLGVDRSVLRDVRLRRYIGNVDTGLARHIRGRELPVILVGATRRVAAFRDHSTHRALVTDAVVGGFDQTSPRELADRVWPSIERMLTTQRREAMGELDTATGRHRAAFGVDEVWGLANEGRGDRVIVEENYEFPARVNVDTGRLEAAEDVTHPDVVDDIIDEIIEIVLAKGGRVTIVSDGTLGDHRIAMTLRH